MRARPRTAAETTAQRRRFLGSASRTPRATTPLEAHDCRCAWPAARRATYDDPASLDGVFPESRDRGQEIAGARDSPREGSADRARRRAADAIGGLHSATSGISSDGPEIG